MWTGIHQPHVADGFSHQPIDVKSFGLNSEIGKFWNKI